MEYELKTNRHSKSLRLRVDPSGKVIVSAPTLTSKRMIQAFVDKSEHWIKRQQQRMALKKTAFPTLNWEEGVVSVLGKLYWIKFMPEAKERVKLGVKFAMVSPITGFEIHLRRTLIRWLQKEGERVIAERTAFWAAAMGITAGRLSYRQQSSRWGSCSARGDISFNWRLIHFPLPVIDYVVIHELAHIRHHNHSRQFWRLVEQYDPGYKKKMAFLKMQVLELERLS